MNEFEKGDQQTEAEAQAYLAAIVESSNDAIIGKTLQGIITSWNGAAERLYGYTAEEAIGQHIGIIIPPERLDEEFIIIGKIKAEQRIEHFETVRRAKDGTLIDISLTVSPIKNAAGKVIGASKTSRDMRLIHSAERANAYLAAIVDSSDDAILSKNLEGIVTSWNNAAHRIFGYSAEEVIGRHISMIIPPERMDEEFAIIARIKTGQRVEHFETVRRARDGHIVMVSLTISPIRNGHGVIIGASTVARDITVQRETEAQLRETSKRKDEFLANISHELRTPMNAVIGLASILGMSMSLTDKERQYVGALKQSADNLMQLINNLLDFSRLETAGIELEVAEFELPELVEKAINIVSLKAKEKNLPLRIAYGSGVEKYYRGDAFRIQQILTNLLSNAIKFTEQGMIDINITVNDKGADKTTLAFEVADTGIGIAEQKIPVIFDKFIQADASTTRKYGGSGLGLSICKALATKMGGTISVRSSEGLGAAFTVTLPLANAQRRAAIDPAEAEPEEGGRKNVLVVDDYEPNVLVLTSLLDLWKYDYDIARNGLDAVRKFQSGQYDVVLMDVQMPGMDGLESTTRIRNYEQERQLQQTPIVAMTAHVLEKDKSRCLDVGMNNFISKPFDANVLAAILKDLIVQDNLHPVQRNAAL